MRTMTALLLATILAACSPGSGWKKEIITVNRPWLDSVIRKSDTSWIKPYRNNEQVTAEYYIDRKDSIVTQLMKDSAGTIRQINIARYDKVRLFFSEYYANGQATGTLPLDDSGRYHGAGKYYYPNGQVKSEGLFHHGFYTGKWKNYDSTGRFLSADIYDTSGQLIKTVKQN